MYFAVPIHNSPLRIILRCGDILNVPEDYLFEAIAETLLLNVYGFEKLNSGDVVVDVGASIGDFALLASGNPEVRVYAFEPSPQYFRYLRSNVSSNKRRTVRMFNVPAGRQTLDTILNVYGEPRIDFLKVDCEGCEYKLLLQRAHGSLGTVRRIAMEIHEAPGYNKESLKGFLKREGFIVTEKINFRGHYLFASREESDHAYESSRS
jgi:hypothetical protein